MSSRPKRKATINKTYNDNDELDFEKMLSNEASHSSQNQVTSSKMDKPGSKKSKKANTKSSHSNAVATSGSAVSSTANTSSESGFEIPVNWQPPLKSEDFFSTQLDLRGAYVKSNVLHCPDGVTVSKGECIYMISEPPGEPYYIGRLLGFEKKDKQNNIKTADNYLFKITWLYRPRDISKHATDSRLLFASMHTDLCPLMSYRGKVIVKHKSDIEDLETYRDSPNCFWFEKLFDRYMIKFYDVLVTSKLTNLPPNYYKALNKRFEYIFVENGKSKDFLSDLKNCEKCSQWCSSADSVICVNCQKYYHMLCLSPPLFKKPSRGFGWSCASCNKAAEEKLIEKKGDMLLNKMKRNSSQEADSDNMEPDSGSEDSMILESSTPKYEELAAIFLQKDSKLSLKQRRNLEDWPYRYLGMHAKLEDALDLQDRPYPRAASRLGSKHQATNIPFWFDHPVVYYDKDDTASSSKKKQRGGNYKKRGSEDSDLEADKQAKLEIPEEFRDTDIKELPPWLVPRPKGYIERGLDDSEYSTSTLMWQVPQDNTNSEDLDRYIKACEPYAKKLNILPNTPNFFDAILKTYMDNGYNSARSLPIVATFTRSSLAEPTFSEEEVARFEEGVRKYGSELYPVFQEVGTQPCSMVVRFYYLWKKTKNGHLIWDNFEGRKKKKVQDTTQVKDVKSSNHTDPVANSEDDSSFDFERSEKEKRAFTCKHCKTETSSQWFRISGHSHTSSEDPITAACIRCAKLWRRYAVVWEEPSDVSKKLQQRGGNGWKRKVESELVKDSEAILKEIERVKNGGIPTQTNNNTNSNSHKKKIKSPAKSPVKRKSNSPPPSQETSKKPRTSNTISSKLANSSVKDEKEAPIVGTNGKKKTPVAKTAPSKSKANGNGNNKETVVKKEIENKQGTKMDFSDIEPPGNPAALYTHEPRKNPNYIQPNSLEDSILSESLLNNLRNQKQLSNSFSLKATNLPLFDPRSRPCCVCREVDNSGEMVICSNCGLNVHSSCYGVEKIDETMFDKRWACDACSNDLHPIISTFYSCTLCYAREIDHDLAITGNPKAIPDALKRTLHGKWCHILCAVFANEVTFGNPRTLQPCLNISSTIMANESAHCNTCGGKGGALVKCKLCDDRVHVSCGQDSSNYFIGFEIESSSERDKCVKVDQMLGKPVPVIICSKHDLRVIGNRFVGLRTLAKRVKSTHQIPLIQLYCEDFKKDQSKLTGVQLASDEYEKLFTKSHGYSGCFSKIESEKEPHRHEPMHHKCVSCESLKSPRWWEISNHPGKFCQGCYIKNNKPELISEDNLIYDTINQENNLLKWVNQPLNGMDYGLTDPNDKLFSDSINLNKKSTGGPTPARISIGDILS